MQFAESSLLAEVLLMEGSWSGRGDERALAEAA